MLTDVEQKRLMEENELLKEQLKWYQATYENRSFHGLIKQGVFDNTRNIKRKTLNFIINRKEVQKKYIATYLLKYIRDNGAIAFSKGVVKAFRKYGIKGLLKPKEIVLWKIREHQTRKDTLRYHIQPSCNIDCREILADIGKMALRPLISFVMPTYNTKPGLLRIAIESIKAQLYDRWELCIADDFSTNETTLNMLRSFEVDRQIRIIYQKKNTGISEASNRALKMAKGEFVALIDHDDEITPDALYWIVKKINFFPSTDILYTDECKVDESGNLSDYFLKPDWSPELLLNMMYVGHLTVYRRNFLISKAGFFRKEYDFSQDYDLMLRGTEKTQNIHHIRKVLYHWRITQGSASQGDKPYARLSNLAALSDAMKRRNIEAEIIELPTANRAQLKFKEEVRVSIIVPTDSYDNLKDTIRNILENTSYTNYEIVAVTNSNLIKNIRYGHSYTNLVFVPYDKPYTFSDKCNHGAENCSGEVVIFFNDDVRPISRDWISSTIEYLYLEGVGGVSPKLIYENNTIQYAGMATGVRNLIGTTFHCYDKDSTGYINFVQSVRNVSILSGACLAMKKNVFFELGGFDVVNTPTMNSDVDLSFKIIDHGYRCVYTPHATLRHIGHHSLKEYDKKAGKHKKDRSDIFLLKRWINYLFEDPYFTEPMKNLLYHDSPEYFKLFKPKKQDGGGETGNVILVSHDLSLSGAPIMLYNICRTLKKQGFFAIVFCPFDGLLREMYQDIGVPVIIDELVLRQHDSFLKFAKNFDLIICNTIVTWPVVKQMQDLVKTIWWIQESQVLELFTSDPVVASTLQNAYHLIGNSNYCISYVKKYNQNICRIYNACYDIYDGVVNKSGKLIVSLIGSIESRKGHDILLNALERIDESILNNVEIRFIGRILDHEFCNRIKEGSKNKPYIRFLGEKSHKECLFYLRQSDVVLNVSRDDSFPVILVEAFCCAKTCIVSSNSGLKELIINGQNGYVFKSEDPVDLREKLVNVFRNRNQLSTIGQNARKTYIEQLTIETFSDRLNNYLESLKVTELV